MFAPSDLLSLFGGLLNWGTLLLEVAGFCLCARYVRLAPAMPLLVLSFAGLASGGLVSQFVVFASRRQFLAGDMLVVFHLGLSGLHATSVGLLVIGLLLVFRDVRERFHFLREAHEGSRGSGGTR